VPTIPVLIAVPVAPTTVVEFWPGKGTVEDSAFKVCEDEDTAAVVDSSPTVVEEALEETAGTL
jgi:hypothetical protein